MMNEMGRTKVFISYSHLDDLWKERLMRHLSILDWQGLLHVWADTRIEVGADWRDRIDNAMRDSRVAMVLVSANYLSSKFIMNEEVPSLLEQHAQNGMWILPVIARPCPWKLVNWLSQRQVRPKGGRPLSVGSESQLDLDLTALAYEIAALIGKIDADVAADQLDLTDLLHARIDRGLSVETEIPTDASIEENVPVTTIDAAFRGLRTLRDTRYRTIDDHVRTLIETAIQHGVPIYNFGSRIGCAYVYTYAGRLILEIMDHDSNHGTQGSLLDARSAIQSLRSHLVPSDSISDANANDVAWALRHDFDQLLELAPRPL